jgi:Fe-S cluster assembly protein SufD
MNIELIKKEREKLLEKLSLRGEPDSPSFKYYTPLREDEILPLYRTDLKKCAGMQTRYTIHNGSPCRFLGSEKFQYGSILEHESDIDPDIFFPKSDNKLEILNQAKFKDGMFLKIPSNFSSDKLYEIISTNEENHVSRHYMEIGDNAQVNFIINHIISLNTTVSNSSVIKVGENSNLTIYLLEDSSLSFFNNLNLHLYLGRYSTVKIFHLAVYGKKDITKIIMNHIDQYSDSNYFGSAIGKKSNHLDLEVLSNHQSPLERNNINFKGILGNKSSIIFRGNIKISEGSRGTESFLMANLLLLSKDAVGNAIPTLEIYNGNVRSKHGETVSSLPDEQVMYLESRGIETKEAKKLILEGFIYPVIEPVPDNIKEKYLSLVDEIVE